MVFWLSECHHLRVLYKHMHTCTQIRMCTLCMHVSIHIIYKKRIRTCIFGIKIQISRRRTVQSLRVIGDRWKDVGPYHFLHSSTHRIRQRNNEDRALMPGVAGLLYIYSLCVCIHMYIDHMRTCMHTNTLDTSRSPFKKGSTDLLAQWLCCICPLWNCVDFVWNRPNMIQ